MLLHPDSGLRFMLTRSPCTHLWLHGCLNRERLGDPGSLLGGFFLGAYWIASPTGSLMITSTSRTQ